MRCFQLYVLATVLLSLATGAAAADEYWNYAYRDFDVTTSENAGSALALAHNVARFDTALTHILTLTEAHVSTHIYVLPAEQLKELIGNSSGASFRFSGYEVTVVTSDTIRNYRYWGPLFGYTGSLLVNGRALRCPYWFQLGVPELFANTEFEADKLKTGGVAGGYARTLTLSNLIPTRTFLRIQSGDPQLTNARFWELFEAESWYLVYEIFVQGKLQEEFGHYLRLLRDGKSEADAFTESFKFSYEDLDKVLVKYMSEPARIFIVPVPREPTDPGEPLRLSPTAAKARLAELNLQWGRRAEALRWGTESLQADPKNELALSVVARADLQDGNFDAALASINKLDEVPPASVSALTDGGEVLSWVAYAVSSKKAAVGVEVQALAERAKEHYEHAISMNPEYLRAWAGLAYLYGWRRDNAAAHALVGRVHPVMEKHTDSGALAQAVAKMCSATGQYSDGIFFGDYWRDDALTDKDREQAVALLVRLGAH